MNTDRVIIREKIAMMFLRRDTLRKVVNEFKKPVVSWFDPDNSFAPCCLASLCEIFNLKCATTKKPLQTTFDFQFHDRLFRIYTLEIENCET